MTTRDPDIARSASRIHTLPVARPQAGPARPVREVLVWAAGAAFGGALIGLAIEVLLAVASEKPLDFWLVRQSIAYAVAVVLSALVAIRFALPLFESLVPALRQVLMMLSIVGSAVAVTLLSIVVRPGLLFSRPLTTFALAGVNSAIALVVGAVVVTWDNMKRRLAQAYEQLRVTEVFEREMQLARDVQLGLLPEQPPVVPGYDIAFACRAAALVGGDTLDFVPLPGGRLGLPVGDVSGKGIAAALLMANVQALIRAVAALEEDPAKLNAILSEAVLGRSVGGRYVTLAYVLLDPSSGALAYSIAGHPPPLVLGVRGARSLDRGGIPLGMLSGASYQTGVDRLEPGETLLIFTDGLLEAPRGDDPEQEFGRARVEALGLAEHARGAAALRDRLLAELDAHSMGRPPSDDTTLLVLRREGART